jgi:hypothetical protein
MAIRHRAWRTVMCLAWMGCMGAPTSSGPDQTMPPGGVAMDPGGAMTPIEDGDRCAASSCQPVVLATGQNSPEGLAVDDTSVYWTTSDGNVMKVSIDGGSPTTLASGQRAPSGIAIDANNVYWVNSISLGQVMAVPIVGGTPRVLAEHQGRPRKLAVDGGQLYWTNSGTGAVMTLPVTGGTPVLLASGQGTPVAIAVGSRMLYWSSIGQGAIRAMSLDALEIKTLVEDQDAVALSLIDGTVYWANLELEEEGSKVFKLEGATEPPTALAASPSPYSVVADPFHVYWTDVATGTIRRVSVRGGEGIVIASDQTSPLELALDGVYVYWIDATVDGSIMKRVK